MNDELHEQRMAEGPGERAEQPPAPPPRRRSPLLTGCLAITVATGLLGLLIMLIVFVLVVAGGLAQIPTVKGADRFTFEEVTLSGTPGDPKIVCVPVEGVISTSATFGSRTDPVTLFGAHLKRAERDPDVAGLLIVINSPGGGITASDIVHQEVVRYRKETGRPVVACMMDMGASGAYYLACGCDRIVAHPTTITGSIGVLLPLYDASRLLDFVGVRSETVKSGAFKDMGSLFAEKSAEQKEKERRIFQSLVDEMYGRFVDVVAESRGLGPEKVRKIADGRILTSQEALELDLIDRVGYRDDAVEMLTEMADVEAAHVVQYRRIVPFSELLGGLIEGPRISVDLGEELPALLRFRPMYLWVPPSVSE